MKVIQIDLSSRSQVKKFLQLPFKLYADVPQWVPPLAIESRQVLKPERHPFYKHSRAGFFIVQGDGGEVMGRLAVLNNHRYNRFNQERTAFFTLFECENDDRVSGMLFQASFHWAAEEGLTHMVGPKGFTVMDGMGLLVEGFRYRPAFGVPYHLPYYAALIESAGFATSGEVVSGYLSRETFFPERIHQIAERVRERRGLRIARFSTRRDLRMLVPRLKDLYNAALSGTTGNVPLTDDEARSMADQLIWFADPKLIKVVMKDDEPVGFLFAYPDISEALQRSRGRLLPFGWLHMLIELRRTKWVNVNGAGIVEKYRGLGGTALLFSEMQKSILEGGFDHADLVQIGVDNTRMMRELEGLGIEFYKKHRIYTRELF